jgi:hypothetical protein
MYDEQLIGQINKHYNILIEHVFTPRNGRKMPEAQSITFNFHRNIEKGKTWATTNLNKPANPIVGFNMKLIRYLSSLSEPYHKAIYQSIPLDQTEYDY